MAFKQSAFAKGQFSFPTAYNANGLFFAKFRYTFNEAWAVADKLELAILPAFCEIADYWVLPEGLNGDMTIGLMSGEVGSTDTARTVGAELLAATTVASALIRGSVPAAFNIGKAEAHRSIGMTSSAIIAASAAKRLTLGISFYAGQS